MAPFERLAETGPETRLPAAGELLNHLQWRGGRLGSVIRGSRLRFERCLVYNLISPLRVSPLRDISPPRGLAVA